MACVIYDTPRKGISVTGVTQASFDSHAAREPHRKPLFRGDHADREDDDAEERDACNERQRDVRSRRAPAAVAPAVLRTRRADDHEREADRHRDARQRRRPDELEELADIDRGDHPCAATSRCWDRRRAKITISMTRSATASTTGPSAPDPNTELIA